MTSIAFIRFCSNLHYTLTIRQYLFDRIVRAEVSVLYIHHNLFITLLLVPQKISVLAIQTVLFQA